MPLVVGLYSPNAQSGKSTASTSIRAQFSTETIKVSGAMKAVCAQVLVPFIDAADSDAWVDGAYKDTVVPGLTPGYAQRDDVVDAFISAMTGSQADATLPHDGTGTALTKEILARDMGTVWLEALERIFATNGGLTPRDLQKTLGLEFGRVLYGADFWIRIIAGRVAASTADVIIIDDIRFPDDAQFVTANNGLLVRIDRPTATRVDGHPSEGLLEDHTFACNLINDSTLDAYQAKVDTLLLPLIQKRT